MRSEKNIEQSLKNSDLDIKIDTGTDRAILNKLVEAHRTSRRTTAWPIVPKLAAAAILVASALLVKYAVVHNQGHGVAKPPAQSRIEMPNLASLNVAYRRGGMEAVDERYQKVSRTRNTPPKHVSLETLLAEMTTNGES